MGAVKPNSKYQTPQEKAIAYALAHPDVNQEITDAYIAERCAEIQARWTRNEEQKRCRWAHWPSVETLHVGGGYRRKGVRQLLGD